MGDKGCGVERDPRKCDRVELGAKSWGSVGPYEGGLKSGLQIGTEPLGIKPRKEEGRKGAGGWSHEGNKGAGGEYRWAMRDVDWARSGMYGDGGGKKSLKGGKFGKEVFLLGRWWW